MIPAYIAAWKMKKEDDDMATRRYVGGRDAVQPQQAPAGYIKNPNAGYVGGHGATQPAAYIPGPAPAGMTWKTTGGGGGHDAGPSQPTLVAKGGGGGSPKVPTAMEQAQATLYLEQERDKITQANKATADAAAKEEKRLLGIEAGNKQGAAFTSAQDYGKSQLGNRGYNAGLLDKYNVFDQYLADITNQKAGFDPYDITPDFNTSTALTNAINTGQTAYRGDVTKGINALTGEGFEKNLIADTMDDAILQTILGGQNAKAKQAIETAHQRGMLNDIGYANALKELGTANTAGMGQLQNIGQGVLGGYRTGLTGARNQALTTAGGLTLADVYDTNAYNTGIQGQVNTAKQNLSGDIYGAVGEQQFFDPNNIIAQAGAGQGYFNPGQNVPVEQGGQGQPLMDLLTEEEKRRTSPTSQVF